MSKIKVIKKSGIREFNLLFKRKEEISEPQSNRPGTIEIVESWIANWREQAEIRKRVALRKLKR